MKRRFLALAGALIVIGVLAIFLWRHTHRPPAKAVPLYGVAPDAVTVIDAQWASGARITLRRGPSGWSLTAPVRAPADPTRVEAFVGALSEPVARHYTLAAVPLTSAGLAPPRLRLRAGTQTADFGRRNPTTGLRYVRRGHRLFMVRDTLLPRLAAGPWQFLSTRPVPPGLSVQAIQLNEEPPQNGPELVAAWQQAQASSVGPLDSTAAHPLAQVRLHLARRQSPLVFDVLSRRPEFRVMRADSKLVYTFPAAAASRLLPASEHARTPGS